VPEHVKVLDSWGLIAFFEDEQPAAEQVERLLAEAQGAGLTLLISAVNLGEVWYSLARAYSPRKADRATAEVEKMGIRVIPADWALARQAAAFKARGNVAYADCFALALAAIHKTEVVTGDAEFKPFEGQVPILWLGRP